MTVNSGNAHRQRGGRGPAAFRTIDRRILLGMFGLRTLSVIALWYVAASVVTLFMMWRDKRAARRGGWRTPESTLHALELLGGWPGSILGQQLLRHKSRKVSYRIMLALIVIVHVAAWGLVLWRHG